MHLLPLLLLSLLPLTTALPTLNPHRTTPNTTLPHQKIILPRTPTDPIFIISNYTHHISPLTSWVSFLFHDPRPAHNISIECQIPESSESIYREFFTTCGEKEKEKETGGRRGSVGFRVGVGEVVVRRGWWDGESYFVGYAPQATYWKDTGLAANASFTPDSGVTYTRTSDWVFPVTSMTVS